MPPTSTLAFRERTALALTPHPSIGAALNTAAASAPRRSPARRAAWWQTARGPLQRLVFAWPFPVAVLLLWQFAAAHELIPVQILPPPSTVAATFADLYAQGELQTHLLISLQRVVYGFVAGTGLGLLLGVAMGLSATAKDYLYPTFKLFAQVPSLGWLPLLMLLVGIDEALKIILIGKAAFVPVAMNTYQGIRHVPVQYLEVASVYRFTHPQLVHKVLLPAAFPPIWNGVRYGLTHAWLALVGVELLASSEGLGYLIVYGRQLYQLDVVLAAVVVVGSVGFVLDKLLALVEQRLLRWRPESF
ncbi:ABC transporter permease [Caldimonas brevitalea]|uniref:Sulfonate ABC transporter n=1 Tax=Caldimonas brevitalea TaxID=413882 RepID=A0A0G3BS81_9BURK|nr:ABC transporter permease [Caldimonas brevitalea]AKJ29400.1 sulfonate ABC transporter [Caldimonas brevitalea]